ncbi:MAG: hypothetical protein V3V78_03815 [Candidatus Woesearchaeota archaeon]
MTDQEYPNMLELAKAYFSDPAYDANIQTDHRKDAEEILEGKDYQATNPWKSVLDYQLRDIFSRKRVMVELGENKMGWIMAFFGGVKRQKRIEELIPILLEQFNDPEHPFSEIQEISNSTC